MVFVYFVLLLKYKVCVLLPPLITQSNTHQHINIYTFNESGERNIKLNVFKLNADFVGL